MNLPDTIRSFDTGNYLITDTSIEIMSDNGKTKTIINQLLFINRIFRNEETGTEQVELIYLLRGEIRTMIVPKAMIVSSGKIIELASYGILVTSVNAGKVVEYLNTLEGLNEHLIDVQLSSGKLGWHGNQFVPYDEKYVFDSENKFLSLSKSLNPSGDSKKWLKHIKKLRKSDRLELKAMMAASFGSILLSKVSTLPFITDLWGETEGGKSVTLMVACSIWANPSENQYIGDYQSTQVALEAKNDMLNHLPMILDDTSKTSSSMANDFEGLVYTLCSGKGKSRSNTSIGMQKESTWQNVILSTGERPLQSYVSQGGAINRILEVKMESRLYDNPSETCNIVMNNYGWAGQAFVLIVKQIGKKNLKKMYQSILHEIQSDDYMSKQAMSLGVILLADRITEACIFCDGIHISLDEARSLLLKREEVSDNERAYLFLLEKVAMNPKRFAKDTTMERWGAIKTDVNTNDEYMVFFGQSLEQLAKEGNFSKKSLVDWLKKNNLLLSESGRLTKTTNIDGKSMRCYWIKRKQEDKS